MIARRCITDGAGSGDAISHGHCVEGGLWVGNQPHVTHYLWVDIVEFKPWRSLNHSTAECWRNRLYNI